MVKQLDKVGKNKICIKIMTNMDDEVVSNVHDHKKG